MKYPKLRELKEAITALIKGPATIDFPYGKHTAMPGFRGKPTPDQQECIGCGACAEVCPCAAIEVKNILDKQPKIREMIWHYDLCVYCGQCERLCTTQKGVKLTQEYDLATHDRSTLFSKVEHELVICEHCSAIIGTQPHLKWTAGKLGPLAGGNFNLIFTSQKEMGLSENASPDIKSQEYRRQDLYKVLCPKCRHLALVYNQTGKQP